jgi:hypothetical protein
MHTTLRLAATTLTLALAAGTALADNGEIELNRAPDVAATDSRPVDRAEVVADLHLWRQAGLADAPEVDVESPVYQAKLATYERLRNGPAFAAEVERVREIRSGASHAAAPTVRDVN